ncbi:hypothetical protein EIP86_005374 [Pleurotus ostreatoroseus]|nr:hypothetical protein EIP86_005374 [Pleurotus ostreatoroseus]
MVSAFHTRLVSTGILIAYADPAFTAPAPKRDVPAAPHFVVYTDQWVSGETGPPTPSDIAGFNVPALSFLLLEGAWDQAEVWASLLDSHQQYNVQFYNQGTTEYTTCTSLLTSSSTSNPGSTLFQIAANGVPLDKLVIGKPAVAADASNGYVDPATLATCVGQTKWRDTDGGLFRFCADAGVVVWQFPDAAAAWIETVRESKDSWPL